MSKGLPEDFRLNDLTDEELWCYAEQHLWQHTGDYVEERNSRNVMIVMRREWRCERCPRERWVLVNVINWTRGPYHYATKGRSGALVSGGRVERNALLRASLLRTSSLAKDLK